ncbi:SusC/RagA family TonB-linked outer membrane protein [Tenacibaculum ovolyticum]|uniref:SusC/RagA family TonB-linked outer membrane protein n=1 Tax=Tenacibaculum ovolyticum TaxID=104270 RepID=UPI00042535CD|nr:TonB-dependent receptor [Tenacibaculum ovolyticum]
MKVKISLILMFLFISTSLLAQKKTISGTVSSDLGGIPGVSILIKGTTSGTETDFDGKYSLKVSVGDILLFSSLGYKTVTKTIGNLGIVNVMMVEDRNLLNEVVVVAYGTSSKEALTGAVTTINTGDIENRAVSNISTALEGASPGVIVTASSGQPGSGQSIRIRGFGSFGASNSPLYVVDGIPINGDLNAINPNDIESISILKDASSTALYGNKATNGVVIVTTKKGKSQVGELRFSASTGVVTRGIAEYDRINAKDYYPIMWEALRNSNAVPGTASAADLATANTGATNGIFNLLGYNPFNVPNDQIVGVDGKLNPNARLLYADDLDWEKAITRVGIRRNYDLSYQGKSDNANYFASMGYLKEDGYLLNSDFERVSTRVNLNYEARPWLKAGLNIAGTFSKGNQAQTEGSNSFVNPFRFTRGMGPIYPIHQHDPVTGDYILDSNGDKLFDYQGVRPSGASAGRHIVQEILLNKELRETNNLNAKTYIDLTLAEGLSFRTNLSYEEQNYYRSTFRNKLVGDGAPGGDASKSYTRTTTLGFNQLLSYKKSFGDHNLDFLLGHESQDLKIDRLYGNRAGLIIDGNTELINFVTTTDLGSVVDRLKEESYFGRANYNFNNKYFFSSSLRRDGSSRFGPDYKWGTFWSVGGSWSVKKENFMESISWVDDLKIRASYGELGNSRGIGYYPFQALFELDYNNGGESGFLRSSLGNPELQWETSKNFDVAIEFGLFERLNASVEFYNKESDNLLFDVPVALSDGIGSKKENIGTLFNRGIEVSLGYDIFKKEDFKWNINVNASTLQNEFTFLPQEEIINGTKKLKVGRSLFDYWIRDWYGVDPTDGSGLFVAEDASATGVRTVNGVAVTPDSNNAKYHYAGTVIPDLTGSISNSLSYKNFDLNFMFTYQIGGENLDFNYAGIMSAGDYGGSKSVDILNRWQKPGDVTDVPRLDSSFSSQWGATSDRWLTDASFLNLRQVSFSYNLSSNLANKLNMSSVKFFANAENLFSLNARKGFNSQQEFSGNTSNVYTPSRVITMGVNLKF